CLGHYRGNFDPHIGRSCSESEPLSTPEDYLLQRQKT
ncbi:uncharacterized, partial [Tachysurus ichikawai]